MWFFSGDGKARDMTRLLLQTAGWLCVALGAVVLILPGLPTTPFLLLAAWLFSKSSPRFERWLIENRYFGPGLKSWQAERAIATPAKLAAVSMMALSYTMLWLTLEPPPAVLVGVGLVLASCALFILTRARPKGPV